MGLRHLDDRVANLVMPLAVALFLNRRKAARLGILPRSPFQGQTPFSDLKTLWYKLDIMGLLLLSAAISLIFIPLTLAATAESGWHNPSIIAMIVVGCVCLVLIPLWEMSPKLAPRPFLFLHLLSDRTVFAGCLIGFFYFGEHSLAGSVAGRYTDGPQWFSTPPCSPTSSTTFKSFRDSL